MRIAEKAVALAPDNAELPGNLALACLMAGRIKDAGKAIDAAGRIAPEDRINQNISRIILEIEHGKREPPKSLGELLKPVQPKKRVFLNCGNGRREVNTMKRKLCIAVVSILLSSSICSGSEYFKIKGTIIDIVDSLGYAEKSNLKIGDRVEYRFFIDMDAPGRIVQGEDVALVNDTIDNALGLIDNFYDSLVTGFYMHIDTVKTGRNLVGHQYTKDNLTGIYYNYSQYFGYYKSQVLISHVIDQIDTEINEPVFVLK